MPGWTDQTKGRFEDAIHAANGERCEESGTYQVDTSFESRSID